MKTLVIHPNDRSTDFLKPIYANLKNTNIITGCISKKEVSKQIALHERIILLGHGTPDGLLNVGQFDCQDDFIVDDSDARALKNKKDNLYIWCHADQYVKKHKLNGLYSGMFVSELLEALLYNLPEDENLISISNNRFSEILGAAMNQPLYKTYEMLKNEYFKLTLNNSIAKYNYERLGCILE